MNISSPKASDRFDNAAEQPADDAQYAAWNDAEYYITVYERVGWLSRPTVTVKLDIIENRYYIYADSKLVHAVTDADIYLRYDGRLTLIIKQHDTAFQVDENGNLREIEFNGRDAQAHRRLVSIE
jgi:hypothetical protein